MVYDALNQLTGRTDPGVYVQAITYNAASERHQLVDPQGGEATYYYDEDGRTRAMRDPDGIVTTFQYDSRGFKTTTVYDYGRKQKNTYDADGRNTVIHDEIDKDNQYQCFTYTFDANNNRVGILDSNGSQTTYTYDAKDRISTAQTSGTINHTYTYTFDSRDNILSNTENTSPVPMTYDAASRLVTSIQGSTTTTYTFDVNGNMTNVAVGASLTTFTFDKENRLTSDGIETMGYHSNGLLRTKDKAFGQVIMCWDGQDLLLAQDASSEPDYWRFGLVDSLVIYSAYGSNNREDLLVDFLGSVTGTTLSDGSGSSYTRYKPYGSTYLGAVPTQFFAWTGQSGAQFMGFTFAEQYNRARWISVKTRQFITRDPLWPHQLPFVYVSGNPVTLIDPSGLAVGDCAFDDCYFPLILSGEKSPYGACVACSKLRADLAHRVCKGYSVDKLSKRDRERLSILLEALKNSCTPCNPATSANSCCTFMATEMGSLLTIAGMGGNNVPTLKPCKCVGDCEKAARASEYSLSDALRGFLVCANSASAQFDEKDGIMLILEIINAVI
ncbi:MAG: hypothetical protein JNJ45_09635 [Chthonomonas sp.]|nr:hypothetical protein [Chthonomonas sp.]